MATIGITVLARLPINNGVSFVAGPYYFDLSYGERMEFLEQSSLKGSTIAKLNFKSILRIELPSTGGGRARLEVHYCRVCAQR